MPPSIEKDETRPQTTVRTNQVAPATGTAPVAVKKVAPQTPPPPPPPQAPAAEAPPAASAASLNADVMAKQRGKPATGPATKPGAVHASGGSAPVQAKSSSATSTSAPSQLSQLERDVQAKKAAAPQGPQASRPGAVNVDPTSAGLENAVLSKIRAANPTSTTPTSSDARAKQQARPVGGVPASKPGAVHAVGGSAAHAKPAPASSAPSQLTQLERDVQAKKAAAPQGGPQATTSRPGAVNVDPTSVGLENAVIRKVRAANPTSTTPSADAMAKQQARPAGGVVASKPGAVRAMGGSAAHAKPAPASAPNQLTQLERDVQAKKAATQGGGGPQVISRPGAVTVNANSADDLESAVMRKSRAVAAVSPTTNRKSAPPSPPGQLSQFERDVQAKNAARGSPAGPLSPGAVSNDAAQSLDDAIARKVRGEQQTTRRAAPPPSQLSRLESDAKAKAAVRRPPAAGPGAAANGLNSFEAAVAQKIRSTNGGGGGGQPRSELNQMEADALAKAGPQSPGRQAMGGRTQLRQLECDAKVKASVVVPPLDGRANLNKLDDNGKDVDNNYNSKTHGLGSGQDLEFGTEGDGAREGLAVAVAIEEDEEEAQVDAVAIEYDPDAKPPPFHKTKLFRKSALISFIFILAAGGAAIAGILLTKGNGGDGTPYRETLGIRAEIETLIGAEELVSFDSPYTKALDWITHKDPMQVVPADVNFFQRYIMAYLYFATTVKGPWKSCNPPVGQELEFCYQEVLDRTDRYPPRFEKKPATRWLTKVHECHFAGVKCDGNKRVLELLLNGNNLSGNFPMGVVHLPFLQTIRFGASLLNGPLPAGITALKHLGELDLQLNAFTGEIPKEWSEARKLSIIDLKYNQLDGTLPPELQEMKDLTILNLRSNKLTGPIPSELGNLPSLGLFSVGQNDIEGTIPSELFQVATLTDLRLDQNLLTGTIPPQIGNVTKLLEFRVNENAKLGGTIPEGFYHLKSLSFVWMNGCNFTGSISPSIGNMTDLFIFEIHDNQFTGPIPAELGSSRLHRLTFHNNDFKGKMPEEVCDARAEIYEGIQELVADCAANPTTNEVKVDCDCCTTCCSSDGTECIDEEVETDEWEERRRR